MCDSPTVRIDTCPCCRIRSSLMMLARIMAEMDDEEHASWQDICRLWGAEPQNVKESSASARKDTSSIKSSERALNTFKP